MTHIHFKISMLKRGVMLRAFDDFLSLKVITISLLSFFITLFLFIAIFYFLSDYMGEWKEIIPTVLSQYIQGIIKIIESYPLLAFIFEHKLMMILLRYLSYFAFGLFFYYLFFAIYSIVISFFNHYFIEYLQKKYYLDVEIKGINIIGVVFFYVKTIIITVVLFLVLSPAYLIPVLNILIFVPIYYFFHKTIIFDVSSIINTIKEYRKIKKVNWSELKSRTGFCFLLTLIPFFGMILYPYYVLYIGHYIMEETKELRYMSDFIKLKDRS